MKSKLKNKKGSVSDPITTGAVLLTVAITIIIGYTVWAAFATNFATVGNVTSHNETIINSLDAITEYYSWFDHTIPMLVGAFMLLSLVAAYRTGTSAIFAPISLLLWAIAMIMAWVYHETYSQFILEFTDASSIFLLLGWTMNNIIWITLIWVFLIAMVMFTRNKEEDDALLSGQAAYYG